MLVLIFILPFAAALLCLALDRAIATRWLALLGALALGSGAAMLLLARLWGGLPLALPAYVWMMVDERPIMLALQFDAVNWPLALLALLGGALALLALAAALAPDLRGFGALVAALLLGQLVTLAGLANREPQLLALLWSLAGLLGFVTLRASGSLPGGDGLPIGGLAAAIGGLLVLVASLARPIDDLAPPLALIGWGVAGLLALGAPPFHAAVAEPSEAPAPLAALLLALGLPLIGGYMLIRLAAQSAPLPPGWPAALSGFGLLTLLACAAGALRTSRLRPMLGWQFSAQLGLLLLALAQGGAGIAVVAPALLANAVLTTLVCFLAVAVFERRAGTDDLAASAGPGPLLLPGVAFALAAASAAGLPGVWGFWARRWLLDELLRVAPWAVAPLLAGSTLLALAYVAPAAAFWRAAQKPSGARVGRRGWEGALARACPLLAALPLVILGVAPDMAWHPWIAPSATVLAPAIPVAAPEFPATTGQIASAAAAVGLIALGLVAGYGRQRRAPADPQARSAGLLMPQTLGASLGWLAQAGNPSRLFERVWAGALRSGDVAIRLLAPLEQRYYLAGTLIAVIVVIMLFI